MSWNGSEKYLNCLEGSFDTVSPYPPVRRRLVCQGMIRVNPEGVSRWTHIAAHQGTRLINGALIKSDVTLNTLFFTSQPER